MKIKTGTVSVRTSHDHQYVNVTEELVAFIQESGIQTGMLNVFCPHTTSAMVINEVDTDMHEDTIEFLKTLLPLDKSYRHNMEGSLNATAHIKNHLIGPEVTIPVRNGALALGTWQQVFFLELCEARDRRLELTVIGE